MFEINLTCMPWDLVDEGIDAVLDRLGGEAPLTGITVVVCTPRIDLFRPHPGVSPRTFRSEGGIQFQPRAGGYGATRVHPVVADWIKKKNPLAEITEACGRRNLAVRAELCCCLNPATVHKHPAAAAKNVFGTPSRDWLCPVNPDVRAYLQALVEDLATGYPIEAISLANPGFPDVNGPPVGGAMGPNIDPEQAEVLGQLCFCESCRQQAERDGVDIASATRCVQVALDRLFTTGKSSEPPFEDLVAGDPVLQTLMDWRARQVTELMRSLRDASDKRIVLHEADSYSTALDLEDLVDCCDAVVTTCHGFDLDDIPDIVDELGDVLGATGRVEVQLDPGSADFADSASLVRTIKLTADAGAGGIQLWHYGGLPLNRLKWIKQASRYARR